MKQFLQPMIEQVWGGVDVPGRCDAFLRQFFRATVFLCCYFFNSPVPLWVDFTNICISFLCIMCISSKSKTGFWGQKFPDVQLIPNFFKITSLSLILQFLEGIVGNKLPNRWILI